MSIDARGVRYLDRLRAELHQSIGRYAPLAAREGKKALWTPNVVNPTSITGYVMAYQNYLALLDDPNTKRLLFDARQAMQFDAILDDVSPDADFREYVHPPFDQIYVELSEPIEFGENEPGHNDVLRAFLYKHGTSMIHMIDPRSVPTWEQDPEYVPQPEDYVDLACSEVVMFLSELDETGEPSHVDRSFKMHLPTGITIAPTASFCESYGRDSRGAVGMNDHEDVSDWPMCVDATTRKPRRYHPYEYFPAGMGSLAESPEDRPDHDGPTNAGRRLGWFERNIRRYTDLITYVFAYTSAKSVRIVESPVSRQQRRWHEARHLTPKPWHIVDVDPKFYSSREFEESAGRHVSYRHDVIGHFRVRDYKRKDGSVAHHISWVPPHQRGLANSLYIPATHRVKGGKEISPVMREVYAHADALGLPAPDDAAVSEE